MAQPSGVVNAASGSKAQAQIVVPGGYVAIYGAALTPMNTTPTATTIPLPTVLNTTTLLLGNTALPLSDASPGQVNGLIWTKNLNPTGTYTLTVRVGIDTTASLVSNRDIAAGNFYWRTIPARDKGRFRLRVHALLAAPAGNQQVGAGVSLKFTADLRYGFAR